MNAPTTAAAIIAGGQARRFGGRDKSRLVVDGRPIIARQLDILQQLTPTVFVVTSDTRFADLGVRVETDLVQQAGAIGGLYTALMRAGTDLVVTVAADMPFLSLGLLRELTARSADADGAWVQTSRGVEPLLACYQTRAAAEVRRQIDRGDLKAADLGVVLRMNAVDESALAAFGPPDLLLTNVNSPNDYARVQYRPE